jgi:glycosyltransferase involved in cell wall biosynthesis
MVRRNLNTKKLVICLDGFRYGGTQQAILHLLPFMCTEFNKVYLVILQKNPSDLELPNLPNLEVKKLNSKKLLDLHLFIRLIFFFRKEQPDVIVTSMFRSMIFTTLTKNIKSKIFWLEQNTYTNRTKVQWNFLRILTYKVNKIICISNDVADYSSKHLANFDKLVVIPNPVWIPDSIDEQSNKENNFIFVGRLVPQKNPDLALQAFDLFLKTYNSNSHLHIVGDGELMEDLKLKLNNLGILEKCTFHGFLPNIAVYELMKRTKSLISTSIIEGLAMVRLEALINGNCVVTTNSGGTEQFFHLDSDLGIFLSESNPTDFSEKMYKSLNDEYHKKEMIDSRKKIARNFSPEKISAQFLVQFGFR